jgi:copper chaperone
VASDQQKENLMRFHIENMTCGGCARSIVLAVRSVDPAAAVEADPASRTVTIQSGMPGEAFLTALKESGFSAAAR